MRTFAARFTLLIVGIGAVSTGCTAHPAIIASGPASPPAPGPSATTPGPTTAGCPVTVPGPVPASEPWRALLFGSQSAYGNGRLWVGGLPENGTLPFEVVAGSGIKFGWWRAVPGKLSITGRRLDQAAPALRSRVAPGYGDSGFQSTGVFFPTPGCWEITGSVGPTTLVFVTLVNP